MQPGGPQIGDPCSVLFKKIIRTWKSGCPDLSVIRDLVYRKMLYNIILTIHHMMNWEHGCTALQSRLPYILLQWSCDPTFFKDYCSKPLSLNTVSGSYNFSGSVITGETNLLKNNALLWTRTLPCMSPSTV
jgi:hypothetical protein